MPKEEIEEEQEDEQAKEEAREEAATEISEGEPVFCKNCQKNVIPVFEHGRWKCPTCKLFVKTKGKKIKGELGAGEEGEKKDFKMTSLRPIALSGKDMALAEILVNAGVAKDFSDLTRKGLHVLYQGLNLPFNNPTMEINKQEEPDPRKAMKQVQEDEVMRAYIESLRGDKTSPAKTMKELQDQQLVEAYIRNMSKGNQTDPLQMMMLMRMMDNKSEGKESKDNGFMDKLMQLQMIKSMSGGDNQVATLQRELVDLKRDMQMQQLIQQSQQKGTPLQDQIMALEQIRASRDKEVKEMDVKFQQERDKNLSLAIETRVREIERQVAQSGGSLNIQRMQEFKEELKAIKEMSHELGEREKGAGEYISETIGNLANTLQPTLTKLIEQKERQKEMQQPQFPEQNPESFPPEALPPEPPQYSDMTETEKQMSDQMSDMYIRKRK